jgi:cell division transport system permease protein
MANLAQGLTVMGALIISLTTATLILIVSLLCNTIMATEHESIALLHIMGAKDSEIARHFQFHARRMALPAALTGFLLALATVGPLFFFFRRFADLSAMRPMHWAGLGVAVVLVPVAAVVIAAVSARLSALRSLREMP